jgi:AcrR family transcriptional regulator
MAQDRRTKSRKARKGTAPAARRKRRSPGELNARILKAAAAEFRRAGYIGATTAAIAQKADVTEAQLFRYFGSKSNLFREAIFRPLD